MVTIQTFTQVVAASGIEATTIQGQGGSETTLTHGVQHGSPFTTGDLFSFSGASVTGGVFGYQGSSIETHVIVRKLPDSQSSGLVYNNVIQNPSFESGGSRWTVGKTVGTPHTVNIVDRAPSGVGFDNAPAEIEVPNGFKMAHTSKDGETGAFSLFQDVSVSDAHTSTLRNFLFSVAPDSAFTTHTPPSFIGRYGLVALEFKSQGSTLYTLAYNFTGAELPPSLPPGFPSIDRTISLTHPGSDVFARITRDLTSDVSSVFTFDSFRIWIVSDMKDTMLPATFDILWDWFVLEIGILQPDLFPVTVLEQIISRDPSFGNSAIVFGVRGTVDTIEKFYDLSQFFFESFH